MSKADTLVSRPRGFRYVLPTSLLKSLSAHLPIGGSLPLPVWHARHRFLVGLTWFHAGLIALAGPVLGYSWELSFEAFFDDGAVLHTVGEGLVVAFFAAIATWGSRRRIIRATAVGFGLMTASAMLVHLSGGYIELHFHFFVMVAFLALYQDWVPYLLSIVYVAIHHGVVGVLWPEGVYNHTAALSAPWTWAGIHAFFVLCAAVGGVIAWRFNEKAAAQTKLILESVGEGIFGLDLDGKITFINPAAAKMMGVDREKVVGKSIEMARENSAGINASEVVSCMVAPLKEGIAYQGSSLLFCQRDGRAFPADFASTPIIERDAITGVVVTLRDVTKRKQAEEAIVQKVAELARANAEARARAREQEALNTVAKAISQSLHLDKLLEIALDKVLEVTGRERVSIRLKNPVTGQVTLAAHRGFSEAEVEHLLRIVRHQATEQVMATGQPLVVDSSPSESDGALRLLPQSRSVAWIPMKAGANIVGILGVSASSPLPFSPREVDFLQSIASMLGVALENARLYEETKEAEQALAAKAQELARSNTELQHFAYVASHDLQEPLRMVASYVQLLARRYKGKLDSEADEFIGFAVDGATRMQALINALLAYSRIESKGRPLQPADCEKVLDVALKNLELVVKESQAIVTRDPLPSVMGDATQLVQLFQNLIANAIKFRGDKRPEIHISAERRDPDWHFSCRDNGIGIDPQFSERIFVIFQRLHSKEEYPGTGIGLALCKKIIERHGGRIWLESEPGNGATFHFTLPQESFSSLEEVTSSHV